MNSPMYTGVIFSIVLLLLPSYTPNLLNTTLLLVVTVGFIIPLIFHSSIIRSAATFFDGNHVIGKKFLSIQSLVFLAIVQVIALLFSLDYVLSKFFGAAHNILLIGFIVVAGLIAISDRMSTVRTINSTVSILLFFGLLLLLVNRIFLNAPLTSMFTPEQFRFYANNGYVNVTGANIIVSVAALSFIIFWLMLLELSELQRKQQLPSDVGFLRSVIGSGVFLVGVFSVFTPELIPTVYSRFAGSDPVNIAVACCAIAGLGGLLVSTFSSIGAIAAETVYPLFNSTAGPEKMTLVNKLTTVFSIILAILMIPVVRNSEAMIIVWYIHFLALFSSPIVIGFIVSQFTAHRHPFILSISIVLGTVYGATEFLLHIVFGYDLFASSTSIFTVTITSGVVTALSYVIIEKTSELITVKKLFARIGN
jgi:hypothetical protein